jgi:hypothetical protein
MLTSFVPHLTTVTKCYAGVKLLWCPLKHSPARHWKIAPFTPRRVVTVYQISEQFGNTYKRAATGEMEANGSGRQAFFLVTRTFADYTISLQPQRSQMLLLWIILLCWRPAISHHSVLLIFRRSSAETVRASDISAVPSLNLQPNPCGAAKKITWSLYRKFVGATQKKKIKQATKSKTSRLASNAALGPSIRQKRRVFRYPTPSDTIRFGHWPNCSYRWRFDRRRGTRRWLCALYWSFLWRPPCRRVDRMCEIFQIGAQTLCWYGGRFCLWALSGINTVLFLVCVLCMCNFLNFVTILCNISVNYSPPKLGTRVRLIGGYEAFKETNFAHGFLFLILRCLCSNCLFINQLRYACVLKSFTAFS